MKWPKINKITGPSN